MFSVSPVDGAVYFWPVPLSDREIDRLTLPMRERGECIEWTGATNSAGYPQFWLRGRPILVGRLVEAIFHGPLPAWMDVHHRALGHGCMGRRCVAPDHICRMERWSHRRLTLRPRRG